MERLARVISKSSSPFATMRLIAESQAKRCTVSAGTVDPPSSSPAGAPGMPASVSTVALMMSCGRGPAPSPFFPEGLCLHSSSRGFFGLRQLLYLTGDANTLGRRTGGEPAPPAQPGDNANRPVGRVIPRLVKAAEPAGEK